jgi:hypothetical protein
MVGAKVVAAHVSAPRWQMTGRHYDGLRFQAFRRPRRWIATLTILVALVPVRRTTAQPWTVRVVDEQRVGVAGVRVAQFSADGNFDVLGDSWEDVTDAAGIVTFPHESDGGQSSGWP